MKRPVLWGWLGGKGMVKDGRDVRGREGCWRMGRVLEEGRDVGGWEGCWRKGGILEERRDVGGMLDERKGFVKLFCFSWGIWTGKSGGLEIAERFEENYLPVSFPSGYSGACADVTAMRAFLGGAILNLVYKRMDEDGVTL
jgi:hypothetical protein